jgi:hypothetical protein
MVTPAFLRRALRGLVGISVIELLVLILAEFANAADRGKRYRRRDKSMISGFYFARETLGDWLFAGVFAPENPYPG